MTRKNRNGALGVLALLIAGLVAGCGESDPADSAQPDQVIYTTSTIWADVVGNLVCYDGAPTVQPLLQPGQDPHAAGIGLAQRDRLDDAVLVVATGGGFEPDIDDLLAQVDAPSIALYDQVDPDELIADNPHIWLDPVLVSQLLDPLTDALADAGLERDKLVGCGDVYRGELADVVDEIDTIMASVDPGCRNLISYHRSLDYFARRWDLTIVGTIVESNTSTAEPGLAALDRLAEQAQSICVNAVFVESDERVQAAETFAQRIEVPVVEVPIEGLAEQGPAATYVGFMVNDATLIAGGLSGDRG